MSGVVSKHAFAPRQVAPAGIVLAGLVAAFATTARAEPNDKIPNLTSADFGWQSNVSDWQEPPPGNGHGPIKPDPEHPYTSNVNAARTGTQPTKRIGNSKDPVLKSWAAAHLWRYAKRAT